MVKSVKNQGGIYYTARFIADASDTGMITISTCIMPVCPDEDGMAVVLDLAHELGHILASHMSERYGNMILILLTTLPLVLFIFFFPYHGKLGGNSGTNAFHECKKAR